MPRPGSQHFQNTQSAPEEDSFSQFSQQSHISQGSLEDHVNKCIIQILSDNFTLRSFKKCDILRGAKVKGRASKNILDEIKKKLFDVCGLTIEESNNKYILVNPRNRILDQFKTFKTTNSSQVLLGLILALIVHNNEEITLDQIKSYFTALSVDTEGDDSYFGNIKRHLQEFEQQLYLDKVVKPVPSQASQIIYKWGLRSNQEVDKKDLIPIVALMYSVAPEDLPPPLLRLYSDD
uniref:MAGE domain-containing protein n=2 Tax=Rhodnius TaxID=13248 RepID=T1I2A9_RHOPR